MKALLLCAALLGACARTLPEAYVRGRDSAESAYGSGHFADAAQRWLEAAQGAGTPRDRSEARYRAATSFERAGQLDRARELYRLLASGQSERAARSTFALADLRLQSGDEPGGNAELEAAIRKYPSSGVANLALRRYFAALAGHGGDQAVLDYIQHVEPELRKTELVEQLLYERGRRLEAQGATARARDAYVDLAQRYPYPHGAYWDDALLRAADCEVRLGQPERAIAPLEQMLVAREASHFSGSYERPRFAEAAYRLAELYRDQRHDAAAARRAFHSVFVDYPSSTLRDDALWQEALLARRASNAAACAPLALLVAQLQDSRYAPCAHEICVRIASIPSRTCAKYLAREFGEQKPEPKPE